MIALSGDFSIIELDPKPEWIGKNLIELNLRKNYAINVVAIHKQNRISVDINPEEILDPDEKLIIIANNKSLNKLL